MSKQEKIVCAALKTTGTDGVCERVLISTGVDYNFIQEQEGYEHFYDTETVLTEVRGFITNKNRFVDPVEAMKIAVEADQVGGILWKKVEARMLNDCGFIDRSKVKGKAIDETIKSYLEFPLRPEDLY